MANWVRVASTDDCPPGETVECVAEDRIVALANCEGTIYALDGVCAHQGGPLGKGRLEGCTLTCPWHGWQYDVRDGQHKLSQSVRQPAFSVRIEGTEIWIDLDSGASDPAKE